MVKVRKSKIGIKINKWRREKKDALVLKDNVEWKDLSDGWF